MYMYAYMYADDVINDDDSSAGDEFDEIHNSGIICYFITIILLFHF